MSIFERSILTTFISVAVLAAVALLATVGAAERAGAAAEVQPEIVVAD